MRSANGTVRTSSESGSRRSTPQSAFPHLRPRVKSFVGLQSVKDLDAIVTCMDLELLRLQVYRTFAGTGRAPTVADLAESVQGSPAEVQEGLQQLARNRHVVLDAADAIVMAHPFFAVASYSFANAASSPREHALSSSASSVFSEGPLT